MINLFKHSRFATRYISIPAKYVEKDFSPIKDAKKATLDLYFVIDGKIVDPENGQVLGEIEIRGMNPPAKNALILFVVKVER